MQPQTVHLRENLTKLLALWQTTPLALPGCFVTERKALNAYLTEQSHSINVPAFVAVANAMKCTNYYALIHDPNFISEENATQNVSPHYLLTLFHSAPKIIQDNVLQMLESSSKNVHSPSENSEK